ncbi:MAG: hypothetical protein CMM01_00730 [Rhodopirellula sp.]|nr:hypothetical protein [Rhodopirellula sp.]
MFRWPIKKHRKNLNPLPSLHTFLTLSFAKRHFACLRLGVSDPAESTKLGYLYLHGNEGCSATQELTNETTSKTTNDAEQER